jgi:hypothetical protein
MKNKKEKEEKKKKNSPKDKDKNDEEIPHQIHEIGTYDDFVIYDKNDNLNDKLEFQKLESSSTLKDWLIIQREPKKTKSRFSEFFEEINQEKKISKEEDKKEENENKNQINEIEEEKKAIDEEKKKEEEIEKNDTKNLNEKNVNLFNSVNPYIENKMDENNLGRKNTFFPNLGAQTSTLNINNSIFSQGMSTNDTGFTGMSYSLSNSNNSNTSNINNSFNSKIIIVDMKETNFEPNVDINNILSLKDVRTTIMIKNIPNKFSRELLLSTIDQNFKGTYDLFILPTDGNKNKNFGYSFINFTSCYFIPFFYYMFNRKKWSSTNSQKICEITYSKVQGRENLIAHYPNKIIHFNAVKNLNDEQKYIIPNEYKMFFTKIYPKEKIEEHKFYFVTKMPSN